MRSVCSTGAVIRAPRTATVRRVSGASTLRRAQRASRRPRQPVTTRRVPRERYVRMTESADRRASAPRSGPPGARMIKRVRVRCASEPCESTIRRSAPGADASTGGSGAGGRDASAGGDQATDAGNREPAQLRRRDEHWRNKLHRRQIPRPKRYLRRWHAPRRAAPARLGGNSATGGAGGEGRAQRGPRGTLPGCTPRATLAEGKGAVDTSAPAEAW